MTDPIDTIIDVALTSTREDARRIIAELIAAGLEVKPAIPPMTDKPAGMPVPLTRLGDYTDDQGRRATIYTTPPVLDDGPPPTQPNRARPGAPNADFIDEQRRAMNTMSQAIVDKVMGKTT
jgi:hypothetical protein